MGVCCSKTDDNVPQKSKTVQRNTEVNYDNLKNSLNLK